MMAAFVCDWHIKYVVAVDEDGDVFSDTEVLWAIVIRTQLDKSMFVVPGAMGATPDSTVNPNTRITAKMGIDATKPYGQPFFNICEVSLDMLERMNLEHYLRWEEN